MRLTTVCGMLQGGGVVDALLSQGEFKVRAISRDPQSDKAKALTSRGVEVVQGDLNDKASLIKVRSALCQAPHQCHENSIIHGLPMAERRSLPVGALMHCNRTLMYDVT